MNAIEQVTVYADVQDSQLLQCLTTAATTLCKNATIKTLSPPNNIEDPLGFLHLWEKERDDVWSFVNNNIPIMHRFECFITDSKDKSSGAVAYALYYRKMPVLSIASNNTKNNINNYENSTDDWVSNVLYSTIESFGCKSPKDAISAFFVFPSLAGKLVAIEGENAALVLEQCKLLRDHLRKVLNISIQLVGPSGCDIIALNNNKNINKEKQEKEEEEEEGLYSSLIRDLLNKPNIRNILEGDPQLHGALCALNRHHNLPILRYRLQRGLNIIIYRPLSQFFEELVRGFENKGREAMQQELTRVIKSVMHFEVHWLGLPKAGVIMIFENNNTFSTTTISNNSTSTRWPNWLWNEEHVPTVEVLSNWHLVQLNNNNDNTKTSKDLDVSLLTTLQSLLKH